MYVNKCNVDNNRKAKVIEHKKLDIALERHTQPCPIFNKMTLLFFTNGVGAVKRKRVLHFSQNYKPKGSLIDIN